MTCTEYDEYCNLSPIVLDLAAGGYRLTGLDDPVRFDLDADGHLDTIAWTVGGAHMALLAFDRNANGVIDAARSREGIERLRRAPAIRLQRR